MKKPTTISKESVSEYREFVQLRLRKRVLEAIEVVLEEEVNQALGCGSYERVEDRRGYRNGAETVMVYLYNFSVLPSNFTFATFYLQNLFSFLNLGLRASCSPRSRFGSCSPRFPSRDGPSGSFAARRYR